MKISVTVSCDHPTCTRSASVPQMLVTSSSTSLLEFLILTLSGIGWLPRSGWRALPVATSRLPDAIVVLCPTHAQELPLPMGDVHQEESSTGKRSVSGSPSSGLPGASQSAPSASLSDAPPAPLTSSVPSEDVPLLTGKLPSDLCSRCMHYRYQHGHHTCMVIPCVCRSFQEAPYPCVQPDCPDSPLGNMVAEHEHDKSAWIPGTQRQQGYAMLVRFCRRGRCSWHEHWENKP